MKKVSVVAHVILLFVLLCVPPVSGFSVPERLLYDVSWAGIKAGSAVQEVTAQGDQLRIVNTIGSSGALSVVFSVDDRMESIISCKSELGTPSLFREKINEGKTHHSKEARFDFKSLTAYTRDFNSKTERSDPISLRTYDSLSSIYFIRSLTLVPGQSIFLDIYDFKHLWNSEVRVVKREEIRTSLGTFRTLMVTSQLKFNGIPAPVGSATVWLTDDSRRIPVRITTKLRVGEITMTLVGGSYWF